MQTLQKYPVKSIESLLVANRISLDSGLAVQLPFMRQADGLDIPDCCTTELSGPDPPSAALRQPTAPKQECRLHTETPHRLAAFLLLAIQYQTVEKLLFLYIHGSTLFYSGVGTNVNIEVYLNDSLICKTLPCLRKYSHCGPI